MILTNWISFSQVNFFRPYSCMVISDETDYKVTNG